MPGYRRSRSRSPVNHRSDRYRSNERFNQRYQSSFSKDAGSFRRYGYDRRSRDDNYRPRNRQERRAMQRVEERVDKRMLVLDDPTKVPKGAYFEHDRREIAPLPSRGGFSMRSDRFPNNNRSSNRFNEDREHRVSYRTRHYVEYDDRERKPASEFYGYRQDPIQQSRDKERRSDGRPRRQVSPTVWKHDKFEELESETEEKE